MSRPLTFKCNLVFFVTVATGVSLSQTLLTVLFADPDNPNYNQKL